MFCGSFPIATQDKLESERKGQAMPRVRLRFTLLHLMVAISVAAAILGGVVGWLREKGWLRTPIELAPAPQWVNADHDIFDIVLSDLLGDPEFQPVGDDLNPKRTQIVFGDKTHVWPADRRPGDAALQPIKGVPAEVLTDLENRNAKGSAYSLLHYKPSNRNIIMQDMSELKRPVPFMDQRPAARGFVLAGLPGYSHDGRTALFCFRPGPYLKAFDGYYVLKKVNGRWEIISKDYPRYYPQSY
jgi:hypothetical protein